MNFLKNLKWSLVEDFITQEKVLLLSSQLAFQGRLVADSQTSSIFHLFNQLSPNDLEEVLQQYGVGFEDLGAEKSHVTLALRVLLLLIDVHEDLQTETFLLEEPIPEAPATPVETVPEVRVEPKVRKIKKKTFKRVERPRFERKKVCSWKKCKRTTITPCLNENCKKVACSKHQFDLCPKCIIELEQTPLKCILKNRGTKKKNCNSCPGRSNYICNHALCSFPVCINCQHKVCADCITQRLESNS